MKNIAQNLKLIALAVILSFGISFASAWVLPTAAPPNGNADAPITTGGGQTIKGSLTIGTPSSPGTLTIAPASSLSIPGATVGYVLTATDASGKVGWAAPSGGSATPPPAPTVTLSAVDTSIDYGASATLFWSSSNATSCTASMGASSSWAGVKPLSHPGDSLPSLTTTSPYILTCTGLGGSASDSVTINVAPPSAAPTATFTASPATVSLGGSTVLAWTSTDTTSCATGGAWAGTSISTTGNQTISNITTSPRSYTITCSGVGGSVSKTATVTISAATASLSYKSAGKFGFGASATYYATLVWSSANATACTASGGWAGGKVLSGEQGVSGITSPTSFSLTCTGPGGASTASSIMVPPLVNFTINRPAKTVTWSTVGAVSCIASGNWSGAKALSGTQAVTFPIVAVGTYTLTCKGFPSIETAVTVTSK